MNSRKILAAKAWGAVKGIQTMDDHLRKQIPRWAVAEDYNALLDQVANACPELAGYLPPKVDAFKGNTEMFSSANHGELLIYYSQIGEMLDSIEDD